MVPPKATKTTNATLCLISTYSQNRAISHNDVAKINVAELLAAKFFGKTFSVNKYMADVIRPIFGRKFENLTYIYVRKKFFEVKKSKKIDFFKIGLNHIYMCIVHQKHV